MKLTNPTKYVLPALYQWMLDNDVSPHLLVSLEHPGVSIPALRIDGASVILNLSPGAIANLSFGEVVSFRARFHGRDCLVTLPYESIISIFCKETGGGMMLNAPHQNPSQPPEPQPEPPSTTPEGERYGHLRVVK